MQMLENFAPSDVADVIERLIYQLASECHLDRDILIAKLFDAIEKEHSLFHQRVIVHCLAQTKLRSILGTTLAFKKWVKKNGDAFNSVAWNEEWEDIKKQYSTDMSEMALVVKLFF